VPGEGVRLTARNVGTEVVALEAAAGVRGVPIAGCTGVVEVRVVDQGDLLTHGHAVVAAGLQIAARVEVPTQRPGNGPAGRSEGVLDLLAKLVVVVGIRDAPRVGRGLAPAVVPVGVLSIIADRLTARRWGRHQVQLAGRVVVVGRLFRFVVPAIVWVVGG